MGLSIPDSSSGLDILAGVKDCLAGHVANFVEDKYHYVSFRFEYARITGAGIKKNGSFPAILRGVSWHFG